MTPAPLPHDIRRDLHSTAPSAVAGRGVVSKHVRCRLAAGSGPGFTQEMVSLLRLRLRLAILIILAGFALHFLRVLFLPGAPFDHRPRWLVLCSCEIAVMTLASALLWSRRLLSLSQLRALEVAIFGSIAAFFAWLQVDTYHDGALLRAIVGGEEGFIFRLVGLSAAMRWFLLIVLYGTFIPNTWRRCAVIVGGLALLPIVLMIGGSLLDRPTALYVLSALPDMVILMGTATAIAVFGSYKIRELQEKAHDAQVLGQYRLKEILGMGGMGAVYLAEHVLLRRPCAIKLIRPDQAGDVRALVRFEREVRVTATLTHWNTVEIFDYGHAEDGTFYYVMEYLPGMNLEDLVEEHGPMPPERAVHLLRQVCQALHEAHAIGLIHRDIKPSNIFACERGKVNDVAKLLDFGLVKSFETEGGKLQLTREGALPGSPAFMSPEQALGRNLDGRSDIYSLGAVGYYLLTGQLLFERDSAVEMLHAHAFDPVVPTQEFTQGVPVDLQQVLLRCLQKDPANRFQDVMSLEKALGKCAGLAPWTMEQAEEWWRRHGKQTALPSSWPTGPDEPHAVPAGT